MSLKQLIHKKSLNLPAINNELVIPGEPLIYSFKYTIGSRTKSLQSIRNQQWMSLLRCSFRPQYRTNVPMVILVKFYISPHSKVKISSKDLKNEKTPATLSFELCDYLLSFQEILMHVLLNSYRQIVKIEMEKFYSDNPRTVFKFMKWDEYVELQNNGTLHTKTESVQ